MIDKMCKMCNMRFPGEDESWGVGSSAPTGNEEEQEDPEAEDWGSRFAKVASDLSKWYENV